MAASEIETVPIAMVAKLIQSILFELIGLGAVGFCTVICDSLAGYERTSSLTGSISVSTIGVSA